MSHTKKCMVLLKGARKGAYARGEFFVRQHDRSYKLVADVTLQNPVAPVDAVLSNRGYLVTFDNWHNAGYGKIVAIYKPNGEVVVTYELEELAKGTSAMTCRRVGVLT